MASFDLALELGADALELDVHLSQDGEVMVIHDESLDHTTTGHGLVRDHTLAELRTLDAGLSYAETYEGQRIPTLAEVCDAYAARAPIVIEIKNLPLPYAGIEERVVDVVRNAGMLDRVQIISFDHPTIRRVREVCSDVALGILYVGRPVDALSLARSAGATGLLPQWASIQAMDVRLAHQAGLSVHLWATSDPDIARRLVSLDVDSIATNHPDIVARALGRERATDQGQERAS